MTAFDWVLFALFYFGTGNILIARIWLRFSDGYLYEYSLWRTLVGWSGLLLIWPYIVFTYDGNKK